MWGRWVALLSRTEPPLALALFRIAVGLCAVGTVLSPVLSDVVELIWMDREFGGYRVLKRGPWLVQWLGGPSPQMIWGLIVAALVSGTALTVGLGGRVMAFLTLWSAMAATDMNGQAGGSYDELLTCAIFLVLLSDGSRTLSLDCRLRTGRWTCDTPISSWPRWLAIFQIVLAYWSTGAQKVSAYWTPAGGFSALWYIFQQPSWQRIDMHWLAPLYPLTQVATASAWIWELTSPILLLAFWYRHTRERPGRVRGFMNRIDFRLCFAIFGTVVHLGVFIFMNVGPFTWVTLAFYVCFFHPEELTKAWHRLRPVKART